MIKRLFVFVLAVVVLGVVAWRLLGSAPAEQEGTPAGSSLAAPAASRTLNDKPAGTYVYVAPDGKPTGDGTKDHPLDLATALSAKTLANPGDTILLRGGNYAGNFKSELRGAESAPIVVREYPGEHAVIQAQSPKDPALFVSGIYTWYCCFEITNPHPERATADPQTPLRQGTGVTVGPAAHIKFIDLIVHDLQGGFILPPDAADIEVYGNIIYYNGLQRADGVGEGHGILTPNGTDARYIRDNIVFNQFSHGIQAYGNKLDNLFIEGNVVFNSGGVAKFLDRNIEVGAGSKNVVVANNMTYYNAGPQANSESVNLGLGGECVQARVTSNYFTGANPLNLGDSCKPVEMKANTLHGRFDGALAKRYPDNVFMQPKEPPLPTMTGVKVFVRPNVYEPGRANIVVFNWDRLPTASVDVSPAKLKQGDEFEIRNAQDYLGAPVMTGSYQGGPLVIPTRTLTMATPVGSVTTAPQNPAPEFAVFVLINKTVARAAPAPQ